MYNFQKLSICLILYLKYSSHSRQVLVFHMKDGEVQGMTEVLEDDGVVMSGASCALAFNGKLFVGSVFYKGILCELNQYIQRTS